MLSGRAQERLLDTYEAERRPHVTRAIRNAVLVGRAMIGGRGGAAAVRRALLVAACRVPGATTAALRVTSPRLPHGPLVRRRAADPLPGTLCPQPWAGNRRLDELLGDPFALISNGPVPPALAAEAERLHATVLPVRPDDRLGQWLRRGRASAALVRPERTVLATAPLRPGRSWSGPPSSVPQGVLMPHHRRQVLRSAAILSGAAAVTPLSGSAASAAQTAQSPAPLPRRGAYLVLLGTAAGPVPMPGRTGIATALVVDGRVYLIDMGHGAFGQFQKSGLAIGDLERIFVTHLHSDHLADLYTLLWLRFGGHDSMTHAVDIHGPGPAGALPEPSSGKPVGTVNPRNPTPGLADFISTSIAATAYDLNLRMRDEAWPDIRDLVRTHEIPLPDVGASPTGDMAPAMDPFPVMSDARVRVSAILVEHPPVFPSYAFRFDTAYGSVVFSGDTTITGNTVTLGRQADILVHEAIDLEAVERFGDLTPEQLRHHRRSHADVTRLGKLAQDANVRTLVLSHLAPGTKALPDSSWRTKASKGFRGRVIVGEDLMRIPLGAETRERGRPGLRTPARRGF